MKYFTLMCLLAAVSNTSAASDPQHGDTLNGTAKQIIKFNKDNKPHAKFFGRESAMKKRGKSFHKSHAKRG
jgi:hypothetical protein